MTESKAIRVLVVVDDPSLIGDYRQSLSATTPDPPDVDGPFSTLDIDLFGAAVNHTQFPAVDLAPFRRGRDAVAAVRSSRDTGRPFSIAFVDMQLNAGLDGIETAAQIRAADAYTHITLMAGHSPLHPVDLAARVPPADRLSFVRKPFHPFEIQHLLLGSVQRRRTETRAPMQRSAGEGGWPGLRKVLDRLPVGVLIFDRGDQLVMANAEMCRRFADSASLFVAGSRYDDICREFRSDRSGTRGVFGTRKVWQLRGHRYAVVMEKAAPTGETYCIFFDVTDLRHREAAHRRSMQSVYLTRIVSSLCDTVERVFAERAGVGGGADNVMARLRAVAKQRHLIPHVVGLSQYLSRAVRRIRRQLPAGIGLEAVFDAELWPVEVDSDGLARVLAELVANACEAMPNGGRIIVEAANVRLTTESAWVRPGVEAGDYVRLSVQDTGPGMPADWDERSLVPVRPGGEAAHLGLGLTIVQAFTTESGGWLDIDGGGGSGATLHLYLPKAVPADAFARPAAPVRNRPGEIGAEPNETPSLGASSPRPHGEPPISADSGDGA